MARASVKLHKESVCVCFFEFFSNFLKKMSVFPFCCSFNFVFPLLFFDLFFVLLGVVFSSDSSVLFLIN